MLIDFGKKEARNLASYAIKSVKSTGRRHKEKIEDERLPFQRDKDRIIHSKAFRRLDEKTQVFMAGSGDHYRTRLTHTLEVAQIARDLARRLELNEDLCEAIALAHDLGHPPFGHAGEQALNEIMKGFGLHFEHNEQSRRVVEKLEKSYPNFDGLNLTIETLDGLIKHQTAWDQAGKVFEVAAHLEAQVVNVADEIAYTNHDMDDGLRSGFITIGQLRKIELWQIAEKKVEKQYGKIKDVQVLRSRVISAVISLMVDDFCSQTRANIKKFKIKTVADVNKFRGLIGCFSSELKEKLKALRELLFSHFYLNPEIMAHMIEGKAVIKKLFEYYYKNPEKFPKREFMKKGDDLPVAIKDYIAGMTDRFLGETFNGLFLKRK